MSTGGARGSAYADLVSGLLDARDDPATERFDAELKAAVEAGDVSAEAARSLRFWQRAAMRSLVDHARTVLPAALCALDSARADSAESAAAAEETWRGGRAGGDAAPPVTKTTTPARESPSTGRTEAPSSLEERRNRLIVAGLTTVAGPAASANDRP